MWLERYSNLAARITASSPAAAAALLVDILDDPDAYGLWFGTYSSRPAYADLAMAAMQALANVSSQALFLVEVGSPVGGGDGQLPQLRSSPVHTETEARHCPVCAF